MIELTKAFTIAFKVLMIYLVTTVLVMALSITLILFAVSLAGDIN
jgi:hypothetical protein